MDISMGMPGDSDVSAETLEYAAALTRTAHAMADYLLSSDTVLQDFCQFYAGGKAMPLPTDDEIQKMRGALTIVHDTFAAMAARAQMQLFFTQLTTSLDGDASPDIAS